MKKKKVKKKTVWIHFSKTKSGWLERNKYYLKVVGRTGKMIDLYQLLYEVRQCEWHAYQNEKKWIFRLSKTVGV